MEPNIIYKEFCLIGCGISGLAMARWLKQYSIDFVAFERTSQIGGLWCYRIDEYGVMDFTHMYFPSDMIDHLNISFRNLKFF